MASDAGLLGLAIVLTLAAGLGLASYESVATERGWQLRSFLRPGAVALLVGFSAAALVAGKLSDNLFVLPAAVIAGISGHVWMRRGGRTTSFVILWASAAVVVVVLEAELPAFGERVSDVALTSLLLACFCSLFRELDIVGPFGWLLALGTSGATLALSYTLDRGDGQTMSMLAVGAVFAMIASARFGAGMLGRMGARLVGLVVGGLAIRGAVGSPTATLVVALVGVASALVFTIMLEPQARRRVALGTLVAGSLAVLAALPAALALLDVARPIRVSVITSRKLVRTAPVDKLEKTAADLAAVEAAFRSATTRLDSPAVAIGRYVPIVGAHLRAAESNARVAADLAASARRLINDVNVRSVGVRDATVARLELDGLANQLRKVRNDVDHADIRVTPDEASDLLVPELREGVFDLQRQVRAVGRRIDASLEGVATATRLLGFDRPRSYFVAVQNNAESRATGGYIANYGILVADNGRLTLPDFRRTSEFDAARDRPRTLDAPKEYLHRYSRFDVAREWTNVNLSPDFPTVARVMADQYRQFSGTSVDGVIAVDPVALSKLLGLTGPVSVAGWPVPITQKNAVPVLLHDEYVAFDQRVDDRIDFLGRVAKAVFDRLTTTGLTDLVKAGSVTHGVTSTRHMQMWLPQRADAAFLRRVNADGHLPPLRGDAVLVTTQNAAGNKLDYFLRRKVTYEATVQPRGDRLQVDATLAVTLRNLAPAAGQPRYVIGPFDSRFKAGQNRTFLTIYSPLRALAATLDGAPLVLEAAPEVGRTARSAFIDIPAGATRTIELRLSGLVEGTDRYVFDAVRPALIVPDDMTVIVHGAGVNGEFRLAGTLKRDVRIVLPLRE